jgi:hypothetical protein
MSVILVWVELNLKYSCLIFKKSKYQVSSKFIQLEPSCSSRQKERQTDTTKLVVAFRSFENAPINTKKQKRLNVSNIAANTQHVGHFVTREIMCPQVKLLCHEIWRPGACSRGYQDNYSWRLVPAGDRVVKPRIARKTDTPSSRACLEDNNRASLQHLLVKWLFSQLSWYQQSSEG